MNLFGSIRLWSGCSFYVYYILCPWILQVLKELTSFHYIPECIKQGESPAVYADRRIQLPCKSPERSTDSAVKPEKELPSGKTSTREATGEIFLWE